MVALPFDVHVEVINWVYRNSQHGSIDRRTLRACSLVCKGWTTPDQRLLFRRIDSSRLYGAKLSKLLKAVRQTSRDPTEWVTNNDDALALLALFPNLNGLFLHAAIGPSTVTRIVNRMQGMALRLQHLSISSTPELIAQFLCLWPDLQSLEISSWPSREPFDVTEFPVPLKAPRSTMVHWSLHSTARWLFEAADTSALRELGVAGVRWDDPLCLGAFSRTPALDNLTSLILGGALPPQAVIDRLVQLEELVFAERPAGLPLLRLVSATRQLSPADQKDLSRACEEMRVDCVLYSNIRMFRRIGDVDWI
ncbi:hypothetical protein FA95DRAFT_1572739 [Auriscalpium vulgare]|uniref:Uncharacterized protein n=1 Tax=Auriscalpium vulgare TaxID=40419 RepID=A0ACB8RU07_9AGAM|nr:hypothetical protein FA95DRAFT_1572739 [Auriscalpium vulgare]